MGVLTCPHHLYPISKGSLSSPSWTHGVASFWDRRSTNVALGQYATGLQILTTTLALSALTSSFGVPPPNYVLVPTVARILVNVLHLVIGLHMSMQGRPVDCYSLAHRRHIHAPLAYIRAFEERCTKALTVRVISARALEEIFVLLSFQGSDHILRGADEGLSRLLGLMFMMIAMPEEYVDDGSRAKPGWVYAARGACKLGDRRGEIFSLRLRAFDLERHCPQGSCLIILVITKSDGTPAFLPPNKGEVKPSSGGLECQRS
ncbi:hypothetical protein FA13DRAFT_1723543 [Coprinellus micaceus]|uniref:Uncharacterized protein n=1 Tax=Coprinellus micaceus TaxID=71717 RepID=A0A4Y7R5C5_COPMI|nr:hypothetical protein FA13DRAFT_1723543 [Coprinellus micaceus]